MLAVFLLLLCSHAVNGNSPLPCDTGAIPDTCYITKNLLSLSSDTYTCCTASNLILTSTLSCASGSSCNFEFTLSNAITLSAAYINASSGTNYYISMTAGGAIRLLSNSQLIAPLVRLTSSLPSTSNAGVECANSIIAANGTADLLPGLGTPQGPGANFPYYTGGRGLGAAHAGAGSTGYDSSPSSLFNTSQTYPADPFAFPDAGASSLLLFGSMGSASTIKPNFGLNSPGRGGGVVWLTAAASKISLSSCVISADGGTGLDAGGGSGGSVLLDAQAISVSGAGTAVSAAGGSVAASTAANSCAAGPPCGFPAGGGYVYARSTANATGISPLTSWGYSGGGQAVAASGAVIPGLCGGAGMLIDCQGGLQPCSVGIIGAPACALPGSVASACEDTFVDPPQSSKACLSPPTALTCGGSSVGGEYDDSSSGSACGAVTFGSGANVTLPAGNLYSISTITGSSSLLTLPSSNPSPVIQGQAGLSLSAVHFTGGFDSLSSNSATAAAAAATPLQYTLTSPAGPVTWTTTSPMRLYGSLAVSAGGNCSVRFSNVTLLPPSDFSGSTNCSTASFEGAVTLTAGTSCLDGYPCPGGTVAFGGRIAATSFGVYAFSDVQYGYGQSFGSTLVKVRGCSSGAGLGKGTAVKMPVAPVAGVYCGGGGGHHGMGGDEHNINDPSQSTGGAAYNVDPFANYPPVLYGGSGGGGCPPNKGGGGGQGGGIIVLAGSGTIRNSGYSRLTLDANGEGGSFTSACTGGGGSGGSILLAFNGFNAGAAAENYAMGNVSMSAAGGASGSGKITQALCGGSGSGGVVVVAAPLGSFTPRPSSNVAPGSAVPSCSPGAAGTVIYTNLPATRSDSHSSSVSALPSPASAGSIGASSSSLPSSSGSASASAPPSASFSPAPTSSAAPTSSSAGTLTVSDSSSITPSSTPTSTTTTTLTTSPTPTLSLTPSSTPPPTILGLKTPYFIAATASGGVVALGLAAFLIARYACAAAQPVAMMVPTSPGSSSGAGGGGGLWSSKAVNYSASSGRGLGGDRVGLLSSAGANEDWGTGIGYQPPSGVV